MKVDPSDALIVVDMQNDFCPGGALPVQKGDVIVPGINRIHPKFRHKVYSRDWHPPDHCSFSPTPRFEDKSWPVHCVAGTEGAAFHPDLDVPEDAEIVDKAQDPNREAYSALDGTGLAERLRDRGVKRVFVCGLAQDVCVRCTVIDALHGGFQAVLLTDLTKPVDNPPGAGERTLGEMREEGAVLMSSEALE